MFDKLEIGSVDFPGTLKSALMPMILILSLSTYIKTCVFIFKVLLSFRKGNITTLVAYISCFNE